MDEKAQNVVLTDQGVKDCEKVRIGGVICTLHERKGICVLETETVVC